MINSFDGVKQVFDGEETRLPLSLNVLEVIYLVDNIKLDDFDQGNPDNPESIQPLAHELLVLLAPLYLELTECFYGENSRDYNPDRVETILVTQKQVRLLKGKVATSILGIDGEYPVGYTLSRKLLQLLLDFDAGVDRNSVCSIPVGEVIEGQVSTRKLRETKRYLKGEGNA